MEKKSSINNSQLTKDLYNKSKRMQNTLLKNTSQCKNIIKQKWMEVNRHTRKLQLAICFAMLKIQLDEPQVQALISLQQI